VSSARFRFSQTHCRAGAVGTLHEDAEVAFAIGLEGNKLAVPGPHRMAAMSIEGEAAQRTGTRHIVNRNVSLLSILDVDGDLLPVRRHARLTVHSGRHP
jgi:hypothetical protein